MADQEQFLGGSVQCSCSWPLCEKNVSRSTYYRHQPNDILRCHTSPDAEPARPMAVENAFDEVYLYVPFSVYLYVFGIHLKVHYLCIQCHLFVYFILNIYAFSVPLKHACMCPIHTHSGCTTTWRKSAGVCVCGGSFYCTYLCTPCIYKFTCRFLSIRTVF